MHISHLLEVEVAITGGNLNWKKTNVLNELWQWFLKFDSLRSCRYINIPAYSFFEGWRWQLGTRGVRTSKWRSALRRINLWKNITKAASITDKSVRFKINCNAPVPNLLWGFRNSLRDSMIIYSTLNSWSFLEEVLKLRCHVSSPLSFLVVLDFLTNCGPFRALTKGRTQHPLICFYHPSLPDLSPDYPMI